MTDLGVHLGKLVPTSVDPPAVLLTLAAPVAVLRLRLGVTTVLRASAAAGVGLCAAGSVGA